MQRGELVDRQPGVGSRKAAKPRQTYRDPFMQGEGPACPPPEVMILTGPLHEEIQSLRQRWRMAWYSDEPEDKLEALRAATLGTYLYHEEIIAAFNEWWEDLLSGESVCLKHLQCRELFLAQADGIWFLQSNIQRPEMVETINDLFEIESQSFEEINLEVPRPVHYKPCVVAHLFSGARRPGDFQSHFEALGGVALSIDIVFDLRWGDLLKHETFLLFERALREGALRGYLAGPPCETWSRARALRSNEFQVRPVRDRRRPFGLLCLNKREASQVLVGTKLLGVSMRLFCIALLYGAMAVIEHPAEPKDLPEYAAIWRIALVQFFQRFRACSRLSLFQGHFGGLSMKPTEFLVANGECLCDHLITGRTTRLPVGGCIGCIGRTEQGEWATSKLKEYPPALCSVLAKAFFEAQPEPTDGSELPDWFVEATSRLKSHFDETAGRGPDYRPTNLASD